MLLYCPKCHVGYEIEPNLIPEKGMKMRCAKCGEVWRCTKDELISPAPQTKPQADAEQENTALPEPAEAETQETEQATETPAPETAAMTDIFARLSTQTEELFKQEQTQARLAGCGGSLNTCWGSIIPEH